MAVDVRSEALQASLRQLQGEMSRLDLWSEVEPSPAALMSQQPFCVDTLSFEQWLQFIMIPKFHCMMDENMALPNQCDIAPMAEEAFKLRDVDSVILVLKSIDKLLTVS